MAQQTLKQRFADRLQERQEAHLYRRRPLSFGPQQPQMNLNGRQTINFCSNDYLGLADNPHIKQAVIHALQSGQVGYGSGAAHLVTGHHLEHHLLEDELADWLGCQRSLLFSTGYMANLAVPQALMQKDDLILADKLCHASLIDGALQSAAELKRYPHNDMRALEKRLLQAEKEQRQVLIISDGVFSMDGDMAPIDRLQDLAQRYHAWLMIDDAHGFGPIGENGLGCFNYFSRTIDDNTILVGTLGKAFGTSGAFVAGSNILIESLIQFARPYIYTTASPQINAVATREALNQLKNADRQRRHLQQLIEHFRSGAEQLGLDLMPSISPIQPIVIGDSESALQWSHALQELGFWVAAIRPPTVPQGSARLRITFSAKHSIQEVDDLLQALQKVQTQLRKN
ncbi:8-amino-7-oxononanoate synthase [Thiomicrorhabdus heinhorstiae]|uniref:8-amino-7-oxononanoate synthase n=1 Tax=Thiomicrorhabdus heinhorstiae TaxID=2748010 RepID=A0ABS0BUC6_9GAMM|nr:8-amino-7-oxononanoate synthase [Thiomicrorhabdus heinhorstiae]MBF6057442.1 8-amino-7-oxononanoate synthase [Thiomicrorhabdus heinhorstiae]